VWFSSLLPEVPILAEEAVEGAGMEEDSKILKPSLRTRTMGVLRISHARSSRTYPVGYAISGERIVVPGKLSFF